MNSFFKYKKYFCNHNNKKWYCNFVSTGCSQLDQILGGGYQRGNIIEIFGEEQCGKTTLALYAIKEIQKQGGRAFYADTDYTMSQYQLKNVGLNNNLLIFSQPKTGEILFEIMVELIMQKIELIVIDTLAAVLAEKETNRQLSKQSKAQHRLFRQYLPQLQDLCQQNGTSLLLINQIRREIRSGNGLEINFEKTKTPSQNLLQKYCQIRIGMQNQQETVYDYQNNAPIHSKLKIIKNNNDYNVGEIIELEMLPGNQFPPIRSAMTQDVKSQGNLQIDEHNQSFTQDHDITNQEVAQSVDVGRQNQLPQNVEKQTCEEFSWLQSDWKVF